MDQKAPKLVVHTTVPKKEEETVDILDGLWACLLNDYLDNLDVEEDEEESDSSLSGDSISTAALRAERRRLQKMKKREKRKQRLMALEEEAEAMQADIFPPIKEGRLLRNMESSGYSKGNLLDVASQRLGGIKIQKKLRDKYEPSDASKTQEIRHDIIPETPRVVRAALEPDGSVSSLSLSLSKPSLSKQWLESGKSQASSIDAEGTIARKGWNKTVEKRNDASARRLSRSIHREQRLDQNGVLQGRSQDDPIHIQRNDEHQNESWHSRRDLFAGAQDIAGSIHLRKNKIDSYESAMERKLSSPKPKDRLPRREQVSNIETLDGGARLGSSKHRQSKDDRSELATQRAETREVSENKWALEEDRRSELDMIRQKKLDRKEALMRIRAIKARIAKLET
jgi:hypothetical protein